METFHVGDWRVRPDLNRIERGQAVRRLEPRAMDLLVYFAGQAGEVISKEQLIQAVWPDTFVTEHALTYSITHLRQALGDDARQPRYVETIPRRGYRLVAEVTGGLSEADETTGPPAPQSHAAGLAHLHRPQGRGRPVPLRLVRTDPAEERCPYPGLSPFTEKDGDLFFGRQAEVEAIWGRIRERSLLAAIGPSGAGKTSFLRASVIPNRPEDWGTLYFTPGANPALALGRALTGEVAGDVRAVRRTSECSRRDGRERRFGADL